MEKMGLNQLRESFLSFFESKGHLRLPSFPLVPQNDNSLLLINAGMAPLKPYFTGELEAPSPRVTTCQKCIRTPDIENVGKSARHGTYFEMLGNFSFADYFKGEAIRWAWEFLTQVLHMPPEKLYCSVFLDDDEAYDIWTKEVGVLPSHMVRLGRDDNFWEIGSGPCGPCSEIYFDRGAEHGCGKPDCAPGCDCDRYVEIWNLVFTQFNSDGKGNYAPLGYKNIDTGMGLERLACVMQGTNSLFEVDTVVRIMDHISRLTGAKYGAGRQSDVSLRIITDHIRSTAMMICDGVMPANVGRGYVLRRLLRGAARHGRLLGVKEPFLYKVCDTVIRENENAYPLLKEKEAFIKTVIKTEEERFGATVESGLGKLGGLICALKDSGKTQLSGEDAFKLYDTDGFPVDLTEEILAEQGLSVDRQEFDRLMLDQKRRAREARGNTEELGWESEELSLASLPATRFLGYEGLVCRAKTLAIIKDGELSGGIFAGDKAVLVLDQTVFYAQSGGQSADYGDVEGPSGRGKVVDVQKTRDGRVLHTVQVVEGGFSVDETLVLHVDAARRQALSRAHSATHLLQKALRDTLGEHVEQAGSLVEPDRLRFDFTHFTALTSEQMALVSERVNEAILAGLEITVREMPVAEAKKMGAMALFGEKYGDTVRVVKMGDYSIELCGGTHLRNTGFAGAFTLLGEASIASGVRRIEAMTGRETLKYIDAQQAVIHQTAQALKTAPGSVSVRAEQVMQELKQALQSNEALQAKLAGGEAQELLKQAKDLGKVRVLASEVSSRSVDALRSLGDLLREKDPALVLLLAMVSGEDKIQFAAACGKEAVRLGAHAGNLVKEIAKMTGGGGGGKPDGAMAGGKQPEALDGALQSAEHIVRAQVTK